MDVAFIPKIWEYVTVEDIINLVPAELVPEHLKREEPKKIVAMILYNDTELFGEESLGNSGSIPSQEATTSVNKRKVSESDNRTEKKQ